MSSVSQWWDQVLDGSVWRIDVDSAGFDKLSALRAATYREAEDRRRQVATHKLNPETLLIQAWGASGLPQSQPRLARANANVAPVLYRRLGQLPKAVPGIIVTAIEPTPTAAAPTPDADPWEPAPPQDQPLTPTEEEALLGPCTCGQTPTCQPHCTRVTGVSPTENAAV